MVALGLELGDDDQGQHNLVLREAQERARVGQQHRGVQHERAARGLRLGGLGFFRVRLTGVAASPTGWALAARLRGAGLESEGLRRTVTGSPGTGTSPPALASSDARTGSGAWPRGFTMDRSVRASDGRENP